MWRSASDLRGPLIALLAGSICACSSGPMRDGAGHAFLDGDLPLVMPVESLQTRRYLTVRRQQLDFSCGSAALASLLTFHYGDRQSEQSVFLGMWNEGDQAQIRRLGFSLLDMKRYLAGRGIASDGYEVTLDQIEKASTPGIALIDVDGYKHFVIVKGIDGESIIIGDPALGLRRVTRREFQRVWNGVLFVLMPTGDRPVVFNGARDRTLAPTAQFSSLPGLPMSTQALAQTRPLPGDF